MLRSKKPSRFRSVGGRPQKAREENRPAQAMLLGLRFSMPLCLVRHPRHGIAPPHRDGTSTRAPPWPNRRPCSLPPSRRLFARLFPIPASCVPMQEEDGPRIVPWPRPQGRISIAEVHPGKTESSPWQARRTHRWAVVSRLRRRDSSQAHEGWHSLKQTRGIHATRCKWLPQRLVQQRARGFAAS